MPILTFFQLPADLYSSLKGRLVPVVALITSVIFFCGWITQISVWYYCEISAALIMESVPAWCPNNAYDPNTGSVKPIVGTLIALAFCVYLSLAAAAVTKSKQRVCKAVESPKRSSESC
jgi:hypothetical protein